MIMFFLRCAFWLSMVYASMSWTPGTLSPALFGSQVVAAGRTQVGAFVTSAERQAGDLCTRRPAECIADAAKLTSLFSAAGRDDEAAANDPMSNASIPLPVPDPRRHAQVTALARAP